LPLPSPNIVSLTTSHHSLSLSRSNRLMLFSETIAACCILRNIYTLRGLSPQANYTDRATAAVGEVVPTFVVEGVTWSAQRIPTAVNLGFLDRSQYFFFQVAPQL
jgi:hypothetical protein